MFSTTQVYLRVGAREEILFGCNEPGLLSKWTMIDMLALIVTRALSSVKQEMAPIA